MANTIKHKRGSGSDPSASDLVAGELAIRTDNGAVFTKKDDGTVVQVTGSSVGGGTGVDFNDNVKARFGTGNDLEIYHNATNSLIDNNTGDLYIRALADDLILRAADDIVLQPQGDENGIIARGNGAVELYYDNSKKLDTKSDGIDVTGEVQCDSLDVDGSGDIAGTLTVNGGTDNNIVRIVSTDANANIEFADNNTTSGCQIGANGDNLKFGISGTEAMRIDSSGRLLVGTSSVLTDNASVNIQATASTGSRIALGRNDTTTGADNIIGGITFRGNDLNGTYQECAYIFANAESAHGDDDKPTYLKFATTADGASSPTERLRIDSSGRVGIGTSSVDRLLHLSGADTAIIRLENTDTSLTADQIIGGLEFEKRDASGAGAGVVGGLRMYSEGSVGESAYLTLSTASSSTNDAERVRIDSSGKVGIGATSPSRQLTLSHASQAEIGLLSGADTSGGLIYQNASEQKVLLANRESDGHIAFQTGGANERMRIDSSGRLLIGGTSEAHSGTIAQIQHTGSPVLSFARNDSSISSGNGLGQIDFYGNDGGTYQECAKIVVQADNAHANNDKPSRMAFYTTADNASSSTERMRIDSSGNVGIGESSPSAKLHVNSGTDNICATFESTDGGAGINLTDNVTRSLIEQNGSSLSIGADADNSGSSSNIRFKVDNSTKAFIDSSGHFGIGTVSPNELLHCVSTGDSDIARFERGDASGTARIRIESGDGSYGTINAPDGGNALAFFAGSSERMRINSSGLDVTGEVQCDSLDVDGDADFGGGKINFDDSGNVLDFADNVAARFGTGNDLRIFHDGSNSVIKNTTGVLRLFGTEVQIKDEDNNETLAVFNPQGSVDLYYDNSKKLATKSDGVDITGELQCDSLDVDGSGDIAGTLTVNKLVVDDDGSSSPTVQIKTDDANSWAFQISNDSWSSGTTRGLLFYQGNDGTVYQRVAGVSNAWEAFYLQQNNGSTTNTAIQFTTSREVKLYYQGSNKLTTKSDGVDITGELQCDSLDVDGSADISSSLNVSGNATFHGNVDLHDSDQLRLGSSDDLRIYHDGTHSRVENHTNALIIQNQANDNDIILETDNGSGSTTNYVRCDGSSGEVKLYHYGTQKFNTKSDGINVTGEVQCDSLDVDGSGDFTGDVAFRGGAHAVNVAANSDIRLASGSWTGEYAGKIQHHSNWLYIQGGSNGIVFRGSGGTDRAVFDSNGHFRPAQDNTYDLGTSSLQWRDAHFDGEVNCDGLAVDGTSEFTDVINLANDKAIAWGGGTNRPAWVGNKTSGYLTANIGGVERLRINSNGAWGIEGASNYGSSGQVLTSNGNDAPTWQDAAGGKILQVVGSTQMSTGQTTSSSTLLYNSTTVSITPSSSSSKILFIYSQGIQVDVDNDGSGSNNGLVQYEYKIGSGSYTEFENHRISARGGNNMSSTDILTVSPNTTSTVTFRIGIRKHEGGRIIAFTNVFGANKVTLMEIGA